MEKKNNNKGFSLVELIVVVLIMAIIAVALAPQVMKWVGNSRLATDVQTYDSMVANCQLALADKAAYAYVSKTGTTQVAGDIVITISNTGTTAKIGTTDLASDDAFRVAMDKLDPNWTSVKSKVDSASYIVTVKATTCAVERHATSYPNTASNADLN